MHFVGTAFRYGGLAGIILTGRPRKDSRQILNGILWIARSKAAWRDLPERYGAWQTIYKRFVQWREEGLMKRIFHDLDADV
jgi:transposase